jgi:hypothetical protein
MIILTWCPCRHVSPRFIVVPLPRTVAPADILTPLMISTRVGPPNLSFFPAPDAFSLPFSFSHYRPRAELRTLFSLNLPSASPSFKPSTISPHKSITMASSRVFASRLASQMAVKAARPAVRANVAAVSKRTISGKFFDAAKIFFELN